MGRGSLRLWGIAPSSDNLVEALRLFAKESPGRVTAFEDEWLSAVRSQMEPESQLDSVALSELVSTCLAYHRILSLPLADDKQILEAVRKAVQNSSEESPYFESRDYPGAARRLSGLLGLLRRSRFDYSIVAKLSGEPLRYAIALAQHSADVAQSMESLGLDLPETRVEKCLETELPSEHALNRLLIFAGLDPSPLQLDWLKWAVDQGSNVTLVLVTGASSGGFERSNEIARRFGLLVEPIGSPCGLVEALFSNEIAKTNLKVAIESAADQVAECEWALRRCRQDMARGLKPSEISIFVRHSAEYAPLFQAAALRIGVPIAIAVNESLASTAFAQWLEGLLVSMRSASPPKFVDCLRSSYLEIDSESHSLLCEAARNSLHGGEAWTIFESKAREVGEPTVESLLDWRADFLTASISIANWRDAFDALLSLPALASLTESDASFKGREGVVAREAFAAFERFASVQDDVSPLGFDQFLDTLDRVWRLAEVAIAPAAGGIRIANSPTALLGMKSIHALGFLEGMFPRRRSDDPMLSDEIRAAFNAQLSAQRTLPDSHHVARGERNLFLMLCGAATESLTISYPAAGDERDNVPAFYLSELERAMGGRIEKRHWKLGEWAPPEDWSMSDQDQRLRSALGLPMVQLFDPAVSTPEALEDVRADPAEPFSIAELREAAECPFRYAFRRKLDLKVSGDVEGPNLNFLARNIGLAAIDEPAEARKRFQTALEHEISKSKGSLDAEGEKLVRVAAKRAIEDWIRKEWASRETWKRDAKGAERPAEFGGESLEETLTLDESTKIHLKQGVDEVATMGPYRVAKIYNARGAFFAKPDDWKESEKMEAAIVFAAMGTAKPGAAIEFVDRTGDRTLVLKDRLNEMSVAANAKEGLKVVSLEARENKLMSEARGIIRRAFDAAISHSAQPTPGEHCEHCDFGEICRRSSQFGEQEWEEGGADESE